MSAFLEACFYSPINLVLSVLLVLAAGYWLLVVLGGLGIDSLDFDFDTDVDADVDVQGGHASGGHGLGSAGMSTSVMRFLGVGEVPLLILLTVFLFLMWAIGVLTYPWLGGWHVALQLVLTVPMAIVSVLVTVVVTSPLRMLFRRIHEQEQKEQQLVIVGRTGRVVSLTATATHGQVELETEGAPLRLNVRTNGPEVVLNKGDEAVVVGEDRATGAYLVRAF